VILGARALTVVAFGLVALLWAGAVAARDLGVAWDNANPVGVVDSVELEWRNPTPWIEVPLAGSATAYTLVDIVPGEIEVRVRFCTTDEEYYVNGEPCTPWAAKAARVPSQVTDVLIGIP
jgi:hypothetical protein